MPHRDIVMERLQQIASSFAERKLPPFDLSAPHDLLENDMSPPWEGADASGVYAVFDSDWNLLLIGRAKTLGRKLSKLFPEGKNGHHVDMPKKPRYVVTVKTKTPWDSAGFAAYLESRADGLHALVMA